MFFSRRIQELADLIQNVHQGNLPLEELTNSPLSQKRSLSVLMAVIREILTDLKQQRAQRAVLEMEVRNRIATRTDALERKLGSLQLQVTRDPLTGLGNRRGLDRDLPRVIEDCRSRKAEACLLMIDVDHFKPLNDTLGHAAGDQLLREIAQLISSNLRQTDQAYRCGGDEFVVVLSSSTLEAGRALADRLASLVRALTETLAVPHPPQLSIGVAALSENQECSPENWLHLADGRLYAVKAQRPRLRRTA